MSLRFNPWQFGSAELPNRPGFAGSATSVLEIHFVSMVKWRQEAEKDLRNNELHRWLETGEAGLLGELALPIRHA